jgi:hypothetical protein
VNLKTLIGLATLLALAIPAHAGAASFHGVVVAKQPGRGTLVLAMPDGHGLTSRGGRANVRLGDKISLQGVSLRDGTIRTSRLRVLGHTRFATIRGVVVRALARGTMLATGRSVILVRHRAVRAVASITDHGRLEPGDVADFRVRFDDDDLVEQAPAVPVGQSALVRIEGAIVSTTPLVVSVEGLPITITIPAGTRLPALDPGQRIELTVHVGAANVFTLAAIDEVENANQNQAAEAQEVEVRGSVVSSTPTRLVVRNGTVTFTFNAPAGGVLPVLVPGVFVEVRGSSQAGVLTLDRLRLEHHDGHDDDGGGHGGDD